MKIEFIAATKELRKAIREIEVNRGSHSKTDFVDLMVSEVAATLRSVGTEAEIPVNGKHPGSARLPVSLLDRLAKVIRTDKKKEVTILCQSGVVKIGTFSVRHPDIETGIIPDQRVSIPIDLSVLDTLGLSQILSPQQIADQGLRERIEEAQRRCSKAIAAAASVLQELGVDEKQVTTLVDAQVTAAASRIRL